VDRQDFLLEKIRINLLTGIEAKFAEKKKEEKKEEKTGPPKPVVVQIIDPKISQNLNIWISKYKKQGNDAVIKGAMYLDTELFDQLAVNALISFIPTDDDMTQLKDFHDGGSDPNTLGTAEQFMWVYGKVPQLSERLKCFKYLVDFAPKHNDLQPDIETLLKCSQFVKTDKKLEKILEIILHTGNFLNAGNNRLGAAIGFHLETLSKLHDTKTSDNKQSVFDVIIEMIKDQQPDIIKFGKEENDLLEAGSRVSLQTVEAELNKLVKEFDVVSKLYPTINTVDSEDVFAKRINEFAEKAKEDLTKLEENFNSANKTYQDVVLLFGEDPKIMGPEEFFTVWKTLVSKIIETSEKIDVEREKREKERKREEQKLKREQELANKATGEPPAGETSGEGAGRGAGRAPRGGRAAPGRGGRGPDVQDLFAKVGGRKT